MGDGGGWKVAVVNSYARLISSRLRATDNERYSVSGGKHVRKAESSIRLLEAKEEKEAKEAKQEKEASRLRPGSGAILARSGQEPPPARTGAQSACTTRPVLSQSNNLLLLLCRMAAIWKGRKWEA